MKFLFVWGPVIAFMALIFAASSSADPVPVSTVISDKLLHLGAYAVLGLLILRGLADGRLAGITRGRAIFAVLLSALYGMSDEIHQSFVPRRAPEFMDLVADTAGAAIGVALMFLLRGILRRS